MTFKRTMLALMIGGVLAGGDVALAQRGIDISRSKAGLTLKSVFKSVTDAANRSTVVINAEEKSIRRQVALGTIISGDGFILTKGSEVMGAGKIFVSLAGRDGPQDHEAKVVGFSDQQDLAMLKIDPPRGVELLPIRFADTTPAVPDPPPDVPGRGRGRGRFGGPGGPGRGRGGGGGAAPVMPTVQTQPAPRPGAVDIEVGEWVASANAGATFGRTEAGEEPAAVGIISVARRRIPGRIGFLGVSMADATDTTGTKIQQVLPESSAEKAGVKVDDVVTAINGQPTPNVNEMRNAISRFRPGDVVTITLQRGDKTLSLRATLGVQAVDPDQSPMQALTGGPVSARASDFPAVYQHDTVVSPNQCGGPIVDLDGHVLGINIARAGRTETYALPADQIVPLIEPLKNGKLAPVNANEPHGVRPGEKAATQPSKGE